jgi:hypothetical protein
VLSKGVRDVERVKLNPTGDSKAASSRQRLGGGGALQDSDRWEFFRVPARAQFSVEQERGDEEDEVECQLKWPLDPEEEAESDEESDA